MNSIQDAIAPLEQFFYPSPQGDAGQPRPAIHWEGEVFTLTLWDEFFKEADRVGNQPERRVSAEPDRGRTFF